MGMFDFLTGGDPSRDAMKYMDQIPDEMHRYYDPYMQAGQRQLPGLEDYYKNAMNDPAAMMNKIGGSYQQSPGFKFALDQALGGANRASAAGGMAGSPMGQQQNMGIATDMANQDYGKYMDRAMGLQSRGVAGSQGLYNTGFQASNNMADQIAQMLAQKGNLSFQGKNSSNQFLGNLLGSGIGAFAAFA